MREANRGREPRQNGTGGDKEESSKTAYEMRSEERENSHTKDLPDGKAREMCTPK